jgi:hypothetical protein
MIIFTPSRITPEESPDVNFLGGCMGPGASLDAVEYRKVIEH